MCAHGHWRKGVCKSVRVKHTHTHRAVRVANISNLDQSAVEGEGCSSATVTRRSYANMQGMLEHMR